MAKSCEKKNQPRIFHRPEIVVVDFPWYWKCPHLGASSPRHFQHVTSTLFIWIDDPVLHGCEAMRKSKGMNVRFHLCNWGFTNLQVATTACLKRQVLILQVLFCSLSTRDWPLQNRSWIPMNPYLIPGSVIQLQCHMEDLDRDLQNLLNHSQVSVIPNFHW